MIQTGFDIYDLGARKLGRELSQNFFDRRSVIARIGKQRTRAIGAVGALVRKIARRSLKPHRRKRLSELTPAELAKLEDIKAWLKKVDPNFDPSKPIKIPFVVRSKPGEPPRITPDSPLKRFLFFALNERGDGVVVGPSKYPRAFGQGVPKLLEFGGQAGGSYFKPNRTTHYVEARPYMRPALLTAQSRFAQLFA